MELEVNTVTHEAPSASTRGRVCFYSEYAYPLIAKHTVEFAGGAEAMVVRLARGLAKWGYDVSLVTCDFGQPPLETIDGVRVLRSFKPGQGIRGVRFFHPRLSRATAALMRADADVYYVCGSGMSAGLTCDIAKWRGAAFVLAMMTDYDVIPNPPRDCGATHRRWFHRALRRADHVLAQTEFQQRQLQLNFGVESDIFPNMVDLPDTVADPGQDGIVLWNATYKSSKRPKWFIDLARELPQFQFVMAGIVPPPPLTRESWEEAVAAARAMPNLRVMGFLPEAELDALRRRASLIVHTSPVEGFSNVLLEAWAAGVPTVSGVDPDGLVTREGIGRFAPDYATLVEAVKGYMSDPESRREAGRRARRYVERIHAPGVLLETLSNVLTPLIATRRHRRGS
jgi:glycosyltransferase involved in cell wall biosynthesis